MTSSEAALIVVDVQEDFCPPNGSLAVEGGRDVAPLINRLLALPFSIKVATQDWHPADSKTFASAFPGKKAFVDTHIGANPSNPSHSEEWRLWPDHCVAETPGAALIPELNAGKIDVFVKKGLDPNAEVFSGFGDVFGRRVGGIKANNNDSNSNSNSVPVASVDLGQLLKDRGVSSVYVVGLAGDYCVKHTALDAAKEGFETTVLWDCTRCVDKAAGDEATRSQLRQAGVRVMNSTDVTQEKGLLQVR